MKKVSLVVAVVTLLTIAQTGAAEARNGDQGDRGSQRRNAAAEQSDQVVNRERRGERRTDAANSEGRNRSRRFAEHVDNRQANQRARIRDGRESGALTRREAGRLRWDQRKISGMERRFESDGRIDRRESHILNKAQNRASDRIFRAKNNPYDRGNHRGWGKHGHHGYKPQRGWRHHGYKRHHGWQRHGYHGHSYAQPEEQVAYAPSASSSLALDLQIQDFSVGLSNSRQF